LGWAQFPGGASSIDGVVIATSSLPTIGSSPYHLGRTAVHEVGHYLNLRHIWGDGDCNADDLVSDTPAHADPNFGCPNTSKDSCPNHADPDMWENYMDYTNDSCMTMFTKGQRTRMLDTLQNIRTGIYTSYACPTCVDPATSGATTTTAAPVSGLSVTGAVSCMEINDVYCLSFVDSSCNKKIVGEVKIANVIIGATDAVSWITVAPICSASLLNDLANGDEVTLCKGTCAVAGGDTYVAEVDPTCSGNGDSWIKVSNSGSIINFYKKVNNSWSEQDLTDPCPTVSFAAATSSIAEGNTGTSTHSIAVNRSTSVGTSTVDFDTSDVSAQGIADYTANSGTITWLPGETNKTIDITIAGDENIENDETFNVTLSNPIHFGSSATIAGTNPHVVTITNDDVVIISFASGISSFTEGDVTGTHNVTVNRSIPNNTVTSAVEYLTSDITATVGSDYTLTSGTLAFGAGETSKTISIPILGDTTSELDETFSITLSNAVSSVGVPVITGQNPHVVTIADDDQQTVSISFPSAAIYNTVAEAIATDLTIAITGTGHSHWHWRLDSSFPAGGTPAGGTMVTGTGDLTDPIVGLTTGLHTISVALVDAGHLMLSPPITASHQFIVGPTRFVEGIVPDWMQPPFYEGAANSITQGDLSSSNDVAGPGIGNMAWCSPTAAACQLGHLNNYWGLIEPSKAAGHASGISDLLDAGALDAVQHGVAGLGTKPWGENGWGDYLIDKPNDVGGGRYNGPTAPSMLGADQYSYDPLFATGLCKLTDFGWFMNTNNSSEDVAYAGSNRTGLGIIDLCGVSALGTFGSTIDNIYNGLKDFYRIAGYTDLADDLTQKMVGIVYHRTDGTNYKEAKGRLPAWWGDNGHSYEASPGIPNPIGIINMSGVTSTWDMIKQEIDQNRTVIACMQGWDLAAPAYTLPAGLPNTMNTTEKATGGMATPDGTDFYGINGQAAGGFDGTPYTADDSSQADAEHWSGNAMGHTVLIVGYIPRGAADDVSSSWLGAGNGDTDWLIVRDNHQNTQRNVVIPYDSATKASWGGTTVRWAPDILMATIYVNPVFNGVPIMPTQNCAPRIAATPSPALRDDENIDDQASFGYN
jgi:hypothetical protein